MGRTQANKLLGKYKEVNICNQLVKQHSVGRNGQNHPTR